MTHLGISFRARSVLAGVLALSPCACGEPPSDDTQTSAEDLAATPAAATPCAHAPTSSQVANAKSHGAFGDGRHDDTAALQATIDAVGTGGTAYVPPGTYLVNVNANLPNSGRQFALKLHSNMTLRLDPRATLKVIPNAFEAYGLLGVNQVSNVTITGGTLLGDKYAHTGTGGEQGFGIDLRSSSYVAIDGVTFRQFWGDGVLIKKLGTVSATGIEVCRSLFDDNRRQGLTATDVNGLVIRDSVFQNTGGTWPQAGIDFEPDPDEVVQNAYIYRSQFLRNKGAGVLLTKSPARGYENAFIRNVTIAGNYMAANGTPGAEDFQPTDGITLLNTSGHVIKQNWIVQSVDDGIGIRNGSKGNQVVGNTLRNNGRYGINLGEGSGGNQVLSNAMCGNPSGQLHDSVGTNILRGNTGSATCS